MLEVMDRRRRDVKLVVVVVVVWGRVVECGLVGIRERNMGIGMGMSLTIARAFSARLGSVSLDTCRSFGL